MKKSILITFLAACAALTNPLQAHEVQNIKHTHAFKQTGYGTYQQGHYVDGPQGSITIWSAKPQTGYRAAKSVKYARPQPITRAPASPSVKPAARSRPEITYGTKKKQ